MDSSHFRTGYVAIIGRPNVGKSTLLNHLIQQKISITSKKAQTTRHRINGILTDKQSQFIFVDTPGFQTRYRSQLNHMMNRAVIRSVRDVDIVLFLIEAMRFDERDELVLKLLPADRPVVLVINKVDRLEKKTQLLPFMESVAKKFSFAGIVPISALREIQLSELITMIRPYLPETPSLFDEEEISDRSERFLAAEMIREKLFRLMGDEIPYSASVAIDQFIVEGKLRKIFACILVEKTNQKAIVIGKNGEKLKIVATQARKDMEKLFEGKVYLEVWVKVKSGWADDASTLKSLGYE